MSMLFLAGTNSIIELITVLLIFVFVLFITYFVTRWIAGYQKTKLSAGNFEIIDGTRIGNNKYLHIIKIADKYVCIATGKDEVTFITEIDGDALKSNETSLTDDNKSVDFSNIMTQIKDKFAGK